MSRSNDTNTSYSRPNTNRHIRYCRVFYNFTSWFTSFTTTIFEDKYRWPQNDKKTNDVDSEPKLKQTILREAHFSHVLLQTLLLRLVFQFWWLLFQNSTQLRNVNLTLRNCCDVSANSIVYFLFCDINFQF